MGPNQITFVTLVMSPIFNNQSDVLPLKHKILLGSFLDQAGKYDHQALHKLVEF